MRHSNALLADRKPLLPLATEIVRFFRPGLSHETGFDLETGSQAPAGAGISGSSALIIAVTSAFNRWLGCNHSIEKLREISQNIEARIIRVPTGLPGLLSRPCMAASARLSWDAPGSFVTQSRSIRADLESRVVLAYTGEPRNSGINNWEVTKAHIDGSARVRRNFETIASIAMAMRAALENAPTGRK